jgi:adenylate kinase
VCDKCGGDLYQREDDRPESIRVRLQAYEESTAPLTEYFQKLGILINIPATGSPQQVFERTMTWLNERRG